MDLIAANPQELWDKYKNDMANDILYRLQEHNPDITYNNLIYDEALAKIEDQVITITEKDLSLFGMSRPQRARVVSTDLVHESEYDIASLQQQIQESIPQLNSEQRLVFDKVVQRVESGEGGLFFLDAPGGTGKTYLLNLLLAQIRKENGIALQ